MTGLVAVLLFLVGLALLLALFADGRERVAILVHTYPAVHGDRGAIRQSVYRLDPDLDGIEYVLASALQTQSVERVSLFEAIRADERPGQPLFRIVGVDPLLTVRHTLDHGAALSELGYVVVNRA